MRVTSSTFSSLRTLFIFSVLLLLALSIFTFVKLRDLIDASDMVRHTNLVDLTLQDISTTITEAQTDQRGFLLTGDSILLKKMEQEFIKLQARLEILDSLIQDNPAQISNVRTLKEVIKDKIVVMRKVLASYARIQVAPTFKENVQEGIERMNDVKDQINAMLAIERRLISIRLQSYDRQSTLTPIFTIVLIIGGLTFLLVTS